MNNIKNVSACAPNCFMYGQTPLRTMEKPMDMTNIVVYATKWERFRALFSSGVSSNISSSSSATLGRENTRVVTLYVRIFAR